MLTSLLLLVTTVARAAPLTVSDLQGDRLIGATKTPSLHAWTVTDDGLAAPRDLPVSGPRLSGACLDGSRLHVSTDHAATIETWDLDSGTLLGTVRPDGAARVTGIVCPPGGGFAALVHPRSPDPDPEAAGLGPAQVLWQDGAGSAASLTVSAGAVALAPAAADGGLWILDRAGQVRRWDRAHTTAPAATALAGQPRAIAAAADGTVWVSSSESLCRVGGSCVDTDGGSGALLVGPGWVAVGGYAALEIRDARSLAVRATLEGRAVGAYLLDGGDLLVVQGKAVLRSTADGAVRWRVSPGG